MSEALVTPNLTEFSTTKQTTPKQKDLMYKPITLTIAMASLLLSSCDRKQGENMTSSLARVGSEEISAKELEFELRRSSQQGSDTERKQAALDRILHRKRMVEAARTAGLEEDPAVQRALEGILISRWIEQELQPRLDAIEVSQEEIDQFYREHQEEFTPPSTKTLAILFRKSRDVDALRRTQHRKALTKVVADLESAEIPAIEGFGKFSVRNSEDQNSRFRGGLLPALSESQSYGPRESALLEAARDLDPGQCSSVIDRPEGLYVVRLVETSPSQTKELASVRHQIQGTLAAAKETAIRAEFRRELEDRFPATVSQKALDQIPLGPNVVSRGPVAPPVSVP